MTWKELIYVAIHLLILVSITDNVGNKNVEHRPTLNDYKAPPWPKESKMFVMPKKLSLGDEISFSASMTAGAQNFTISLVSGNEYPDYENICNQLVVKMPSDYDSENFILSRLVYRGEEQIENNYDIKATHYFSDTNIQVMYTLTMMEDGDTMLSIYIGENNFYANVKLKHNVEDIRFLTFNGDIDKVRSLNFTFAEY